MSASARQSELFAGQDWTVLYRAFSAINFNASDPPSINAALRNYIQQNYPEDFNDWIENSEFVALIDLLSWLAGTLAFKTDIAARENFLDTAQARESVLRLARFLSYNPGRCQSASGVVKLVQVTTNADVIDSFGSNLNGQTVTWNDPNNSNWLEDFTLVLNDAFIPTNPYGVPYAVGAMSGLQTVQQYCLNALMSSQNLSFTATVSAQNMGFEICNAGFDSNGNFVEQTPDPNNALNLYYLSDGMGSGSNYTGFFLLFKQGSSQSQTFNIVTPIANQTLPITSGNINQTDVWVQTLNTDGSIAFTWTAVPSIAGFNISFNNVPATERNVYQVVTQDGDGIMIRFSDGNFANAPSGLVQVSYRVANGLTYQITPQDISLISVPVTYYNAQGIQHTLTLTFSLYDTISNAASTETMAQIRSRAPQVYATQNRMVSGEDYNAYPLSANLASKIKAVNRVYSGQSRYINLNDPTGTYQDLSIFADDGLLYQQPASAYTEFALTTNLTAQTVIDTIIQPMLQNSDLQALVSDIYLRAIGNNTLISPIGMIWQQSTASLYSSTGWMAEPSNAATNSYAIDPASLIQPGAMLEIVTPTLATLWVGVDQVSGTVTYPASQNTAGPVTLTAAVPSNSVVSKILPAFQASITAISSAILNNINAKLSFSLVYDYTQNGWLAPVTGTTTLPSPLALSGTQLPLMTVNYLAGMWQVSAPGLSYVFESLGTVEFFDSGQRAIDQQTGNASLDTLQVMKLNVDLASGTGLALTQPYTWAAGALYVYPDGTPEPARTLVSPLDSTGDGFPDVPDAFYRVISGSSQQTYLFWQNQSGAAAVPYTTMTVYETEASRSAATPTAGTVAFQISSPASYRTNTFWIATASGSTVTWVQDTSSVYSFAIGRGSNVAQTWVTAGGTVATPSSDAINFHWKHYAPTSSRIDPASQNIIDMFVLTYSYDAAVRTWIAGGASGTVPQPPSELQLRLAYENVENYRMFSDAMIWHPVSYKFLFGPSADASLQVQFKVVPMPNTGISDGQIQTAVITAINTYFAVQNWDFGETFYYTELAAYIHQQLVGQIVSCVLVPLAANAEFGDGFEVSCNPDEIFVSTATVQNVVVISSNTPSILRMR